MPFWTATEDGIGNTNVLGPFDTDKEARRAGEKWLDRPKTAAMRDAGDDDYGTYEAESEGEVLSML